jgi:hypothetical protein
MTPAIPAALVGLLACSMQHCGPTPKESGDTILMVLPFVVLSAMGVQWVFLKLWKSLRQSIVLDWGRNLFFCGALLLPAGYAFLTDGRPGEWLPIAYWLFGCSYVAAMLLVTRLMLLSNDARLVFFVPHLFLSAIFAAPALPLALGLAQRKWQDASEMMWIMPGFGGWVPGGLFLLLFIEVLWRRARLRRLGSGTD